MGSSEELVDDVDISFDKADHMKHHPDERSWRSLVPVREVLD